MEPIKCVLLERTDSTRLFFRRYKAEASEYGPNICPKKGYHTQILFYKNIFSKEEGDYLDIQEVIKKEGAEKWPDMCECGYKFMSGDMWQILMRHLYKIIETGEILILDDAPVGSMWYADWLQEIYKGPDGKCLVVRMPDGMDWVIDGRADNCSMPDDRIHNCWIRHGTPPLITVDKNGSTCSKGCGAIKMKTWHGFLKNGFLVQA